MSSFYDRYLARKSVDLSQQTYTQMMDNLRAIQKHNAPILDDIHTLDCALSRTREGTELYTLYVTQRCLKVSQLK